MQYKAFFAERPKSFPQVSISKPMAAFVTIGSPKNSWNNYANSFPIRGTITLIRFYFFTSFR